MASIFLSSRDYNNRYNMFESKNINKIANQVFLTNGFFFLDDDSLSKVPCPSGSS